MPIVAARANTVELNARDTAALEDDPYGGGKVERWPALPRECPHAIPEPGAEGIQVDTAELIATGSDARAHDRHLGTRSRLRQALRSPFDNTCPEPPPSGMDDGESTGCGQYDGRAVGDLDAQHGVGPDRDRGVRLRPDAITRPVDQDHPFTVDLAEPGPRSGPQRLSALEEGTGRVVDGKAAVDDL